MKRRRFFDQSKVTAAVSAAAASAAAGATTADDGHRFIEQFNADMMEQFLAHQRKMQVSND